MKVLWTCVFCVLLLAPQSPADHLDEVLEQATMLCSNDNTPMCARSRTEYLLFQNECHLRKAQRSNLMGPLFDAALRYCLPDCEFACGFEYKPICGISVDTGRRKNFRNRCEMARTSCLSKGDWLVYKWGICPTGRNERRHHTVFVGQPKAKRRQPIPCTKVYRPVCAAYGGVKSTFSNECLVNAENIRTGRNWRIVSEGLCGEDTTKLKHNRKYKPKAKPKTEADRTKRSHKKVNLVDDFEVADEVVQIYAPSTFHTQFISNTGTMEKSYSLPARKPYVVSRPKSRRRPIAGAGKSPNKQSVDAKPCVFSNEPVCGSFNGESRTFSNVCNLMEYSQRVGNAWAILYEGPCRSCDYKCPTDYRPICVKRNGISYTIMNECYLSRVRCKDPSSVWKITQMGECALPAEEVAESIATDRTHQPNRIPSVLYATSQPERANSTKTATEATMIIQKWRRPTTTTSMPATSRNMKLRKPVRKPTISANDSNNRKIRKIQLASFGGFKAKHLSESPIDRAENAAWEGASATSKSLLSNDNWLVPRTLDNVKNIFAKKSHNKKMYHAKPHKFVRPMPTRATTSPPMPATTRATTTTTSTTAKMMPITEIPDFTNGEPIYEEIDASSKMLFMPAITTSTEPITPESTEIAEVSTLTTLLKSEADSTTATTAISTTLQPSTSAETTTQTDLSTGSSEAEHATSTTVGPLVPTHELQPPSTPSETTATTTPTAMMTTLKAITAALSPAALSLDYMTDDPVPLPGQHTSIYGLDKNSLIMRLLRARSSLRNLVL
ncbi:mucin-2 [Scaptodrosophila lebanonensis]|uniref:Mucin-2 n=1 Tax=Drosophila lebanonensis TaxID=7225 RepID=A0A6J2T753_DROLE|nr:mucin-2 [Scaptodrosophila lebanonensis]